MLKVRGKAIAKGLSAIDANTSQWSRFIAKGKELAKSGKEKENFKGSSDVVSRLNMRVQPLIKSSWGTVNAGGLACYNYYTPSYWTEPDVHIPKVSLMRYLSRA